MKNVTDEIKAWVKGNLKDKRLPKWWKLSRTRLSLKKDKYVHLTGKAWHTGAILQYLADLFTNQPVPQLDSNVKHAVWTANQLFGFLTSLRSEQGLWLKPEDMQQAKTLGNYFLRMYVELHTTYRNLSHFRLFNCRPKLHLMAHMVAGLACSPRNPLIDAVWMDENWIGQIMHLAKKTHSKRTYASTLMRYSAGLLPLRFLVTRKLLTCSCLCRIEVCFGRSIQAPGRSPIHCKQITHACQHAWHCIA